MPDLRPASAGPLGDDVRSDLPRRLRSRRRGLDLEISSKVDYLYGEAIEAAVRRVADGLGSRPAGSR